MSSSCAGLRQAITIAEHIIAIDNYVLYDINSTIQRRLLLLSFSPFPIASLGLVSRDKLLQSRSVIKIRKKSHAWKIDMWDCRASDTPVKLINSIRFWLWLFALSFSRTHLALIIGYASAKPNTTYVGHVTALTPIRGSPFEVLFGLCWMLLSRSFGGFTAAIG